MEGFVHGAGCRNIFCFPEAGQAYHEMFNERYLPAKNDEWDASLLFLKYLCGACVF